MSGYLPVRVNVPLADYRRLYVEATRRGITVGEQIAQEITITAPEPSRRGRTSRYTTRAGEDITADRRFGMSWPEIGRRHHIDHTTARAWAGKYETEVREQNARDRAERNTP